ncbi:hypothetical protein C8R43DRAFT_1128340 [Mycena crocata]|nr:hypothetical protein C8R43DRAFT_1128340 [Mycena crocata]
MPSRVVYLFFTSAFFVGRAFPISLHVAENMHRIFTIPFIACLPPPSAALNLGTPQPQNTLSMSVFTGGALSLSWILNASDPKQFDLVLVGPSGNAAEFPAIHSDASPLHLLFSSPPQNYFFRALDNSTGTTLAESGTFEVTVAPSMLPGSMMPPNAMEAPTSTGTPKQSEVAQARAQPSRKSLIGGIIGGAAAIILILLAVLVWRFRRRASSSGPVLIDDDAYSKYGREDPSLPVYAKLSPFPMTHAPPDMSMSPLHVAHLRPMSSTASRNRKSTSYYPTSPASTRRPSSSYETGPKTGHRRQLSYDIPPSSPLSYQSPTSESPKHMRASYFDGGFQRPKTRTSHHRQASYDIVPASPLSHNSPTASKRRRSSYIPSRAATAPPRGSITPAGARRLELQVELETALSETVYEKDEPETPSKTPTRRRPLRCTSEPRPLSSEFGSADGHALEEAIRKAQEPPRSGFAPNLGELAESFVYELPATAMRK